MAIDQSLELGTPEAAVRSCVELLSMLFEQPVDKTAYYLDLYFQVRRVYEEQRQRNEAAARFLEQFTRPEEPEPNVYPEPRRTMNEVRTPEAEERPGDDGPAKASAFTETPSVTSVRTGDSSPSGGAKKEAPPGGEKTEKARGEKTEKALEEKFREVLNSVNAGLRGDDRGSKSYGNHNAANAAAEKRRIRERLMQMREAGLSTPEILKSGRGSITEDQIRAIIEAKPVPIAVYRALDSVLEVLAAAAPET